MKRVANEACRQEYVVYSIPIEVATSVISFIESSERIISGFEILVGFLCPGIRSGLFPVVLLDGLADKVPLTPFAAIPPLQTTRRAVSGRDTIIASRHEALRMVSSQNVHLQFFRSVRIAPSIGPILGVVSVPPYELVSTFARRQHSSRTRKL